MSLRIYEFFFFESCDRDVLHIQIIFCFFILPEFPPCRDDLLLKAAELQQNRSKQGKKHTTKLIKRSLEITEAHLLLKTVQITNQRKNIVLRKNSRV